MFTKSLEFLRKKNMRSSNKMSEIELARKSDN